MVRHDESCVIWWSNREKRSCGASYANSKGGSTPMLASGGVIPLDLAAPWGRKVLDPGVGKYFFLALIPCSSISMNV